MLALSPLEVRQFYGLLAVQATMLAVGPVMLSGLPPSSVATTGLLSSHWSRSQGHAKMTPDVTGTAAWWVAAD